MASGSSTADGDVDSESRHEILALAEERSLALGREALTEQARRAVRQGESGLWHLRRFVDGALASYGLLSTQESGCELELLGDELDPSILEAAQELSATLRLPLSLWTHGSAELPEPPLPGYERVRVIDRLSRPLPAEPPGTLAPELAARSFAIGADEAAFLALNARSFATHPDQGAMSLEDLRARELESWFDAQGFLLVEGSGALLGFCWTKIHDEPWSSVGEIYVIGVDPTASGLGLGRWLLRAGLASMHARGVDEAMLYVEHDNVPAQHLYGSEGFTLAWHDARFEPIR
jgi:mycothiol synthase